MLVSKYQIRQREGWLLSASTRSDRGRGGSCLQVPGQTGGGVALVSKYQVSTGARGGGVGVGGGGALSLVSKFQVRQGGRWLLTVCKYQVS